MNANAYNAYGLLGFGKREDLTAGCDEQFSWAHGQINLASAGNGLDTWRSPGASFDGQRSTHPTSIVTAPRNVAGAYFRAAYWMALTARLATGAGLSPQVASRLISKAGAAAVKGDAACAVPFFTSAPSYIRAIFKAAAVEIQGAVDAGLPAWKVQTILFYLEAQQSGDAIRSTQDMKSQADIPTVIAGGVRETAEDIGEATRPIVDLGGATIDIMAFLYRYGPWILLGALAVTGTTVVAKLARRRNVV